METSKLSLKQKLIREMQRAFVVACYLWGVFSLFVLYDSVISKDSHGSLMKYGLALFNALALAKVILVAQHFHLAEGFRKSPLIYVTIFRSIVFALLLGCFKIVEAMVFGYIRGRTLAESFSAIGDGSLRGLLTLMLLLAVVLIPFFGFAELDRAVGKGKIATVFLKSRYTLGEIPEVSG
jgi:hypothetical protein